MGWAEAIKAAADAVEAMKNAELLSKFAHVKMEVAKLAEENALQRERIRELEAMVQTRNSLRFEHDCYWIPDGEGDEKQGPFCQRCQDVDGRLVRLISDGDPYCWSCRECSSTIWKPRGRARLIERRTRAFDGMR